MPGTALHHVLSHESAGWSHTDYLLADIYDAVAWNSYVTARSQGTKMKRPKPHPRPGVTDATSETKTFRTRKPVTLAQLRERFKWDN